MEEVNEFKYLGTILCKQGSMEGEIRERTVKGRQVMGALERVMTGRSVSMAVKKGIRNSVILPTLSYASETWTWNAAQQSRIQAVEMSYMWGACGVCVSRWDAESNEDTYGRLGKSEAAVGMDCGVVEWVKQSTLTFTHLPRPFLTSLHFPTSFLTSTHLPRPFLTSTHLPTSFFTFIHLPMSFLTFLHLPNSSVLSRFVLTRRKFV